MSINNLGLSGIRLKYSSIEKYPLESSRIHQLLNPFSDRLTEVLPAYESFWHSFFPGLQEGWNHNEWVFEGVTVDFNLYYGDALNWSCEKAVPDIEAWFLDGHSPDKNPGIWSLQIMKAVFDNTAAGGTLASFTASGLVKSALRDAGFFIKRKKGFGTKRHMIQGYKS